MKDFELIPRVNITHSPTPLEFLPRLSNELQCNLYIKRDDCTGLAGGGNKTRKLEYLIADAKQQDADTLVTVGGFQSNHARQTAAAAAKFGFGCELVLEDVSGTPKEDYYNNGNMLLDSLLGANIHPVDIDDDCNDVAQALIKKLEGEGKKPYLIPMGGSNVIGSLGYVRCANELVQQLATQNTQIDQIVLATGSAGTQAGLLAGLIAAGSDIPVLGINVSRSAEEQNKLVEQLLKQMLTHLEFDPKLSANKVATNGNYYGEGYGITTAAMISAVKCCAQLEGLLLDPVYTGKAMAGLIDLCETGEIKPGSNILFLHTGGSQGLFSYREAFEA
ncbi:D-cysteine desulfhydrase [Photobacterium sanctipauli]|uniref:D-cysteine desulfhydrase n=1 Tax=Photobacterium sanctipauli TaxID=1342794 RepID=A0A2T3NU59_9GAMM|nr:D-cysteine desulfhydrase [Photobacterium sanctipauli]PSW19768.1 D-cysteine desulfhydrase [Photobacterium sanctipauli]